MLNHVTWQTSCLRLPDHQYALLLSRGKRLHTRNRHSEIIVVIVDFSGIFPWIVSGMFQWRCTFAAARSKGFAIQVDSLESSVAFSNGFSPAWVCVWIASETMNDRECLSGCCSVGRTEPERIQSTESHGWWSEDQDLTRAQESNSSRVQSPGDPKTRDTILNTRWLCCQQMVRLEARKLFLECF